MPMPDYHVQKIRKRIMSNRIMTLHRNAYMMAGKIAEDEMRGNCFFSVQCRSRVDRQLYTNEQIDSAARMGMQIWPVTYSQKFDLLFALAVQGDPVVYSRKMLKDEIGRVLRRLGHGDEEVRAAQEDEERLKGFARMLAQRDVSGFWQTGSLNAIWEFKEDTAPERELVFSGGLSNEDVRERQAWFSLLCTGRFAD